MTTDAKRKAVEAMIDKAQKATTADDAMRWTQAACNAANAMCAVRTAETMK